MLCESCGKNEAYLHYTKIINGKVEEMHLCGDCAAKNYDFDFGDPFSMNKLFTGLIGGGKESGLEFTGPQCPNCGLSYNDFKREGKFGCSKCYEVFKDKLDPLVRGLHGHNSHRGKIPSTADEKVFLRREVDDLRDQLEDAIKSEEFELAAVIRDKLREAKTKLEGYRE